MLKNIQHILGDPSLIFSDENGMDPYYTLFGKKDPLGKGGVDFRILDSAQIPNEYTGLIQWDDRESKCQVRDFVLVYGAADIIDFAGPEKIAQWKNVPPMCTSLANMHPSESQEISLNKAFEESEFEEMGYILISVRDISEETLKMYNQSISDTQTHSEVDSYFSPQNSRITMQIRCRLPERVWKIFQFVFHTASYDNVNSIMEAQSCFPHGCVLQFYMALKVAKLIEDGKKVSIESLQKQYTALYKRLYCSYLLLLAHSGKEVGQQFLRNMEVNTFLMLAENNAKWRAKRDELIPDDISDAEKYLDFTKWDSVGTLDDEHPMISE